MILPWLKGIFSFDRTPLTWTFLALNIIIYMLTHSPNSAPEKNSFLENNNMRTTAILYWQFSGQKGLPPKEQLDLLSIQALQNPHFLLKAEEYLFVGDEVQIKKWKEELQQFKRSIDLKMEAQLGLNHFSSPGLAWITYQFMHVGFFHLVGNMSLLLIFASAVELMVGSMGLLILYITGGIAAGLSFLKFGQPSLAPMVGASGAVSALIAFYAIAEIKKRVSFFYFFSPFKGYYGWIYLPTVLILPLSFASDIASFISTALFPTGIASSAHLGGALFGVAVGTARRMSRRLGFVETSSKC